jgi:hypothetical protein
MAVLSAARIACEIIGVCSGQVWGIRDLGVAMSWARMSRASLNALIIRRVYAGRKYVDISTGRTDLIRRETLARRDFSESIGAVFSGAASSAHLTQG